MFGWPGRAYVISDLHLATICIYYQYWQEKETAKYPFLRIYGVLIIIISFTKKEKKKSLDVTFIIIG